MTDFPAQNSTHGETDVTESESEGADETDSTESYPYSDLEDKKYYLGNLDDENKTLGQDRST